MAPEDSSATPEEMQVAKLVAALETIELSKFRVVGGIVRYDESARNILKDTKQKISTSLSAHARGRDNYLIWAPPGSGKSFFVQEVAKSLGSGIHYKELNLARLNEQEFRSELDKIEKVDQPRLCFIDEVDSKPSESWPYEALLPSLEPPSRDTIRTCFVLAGSGGKSISEMKRRIVERPKGSDLLSRIPNSNESTIPGLGVGDKLLVASAQFLRAAEELGRNIDEVEKLVLYYVALNPGISSARQIRDLAIRCIERMPPGEERIKYDYLFSAGDPENKLFWIRAQSEENHLVNLYVSIKSSEQRIVKHKDLEEASQRKKELLIRKKKENLPLDIHRIAVLPFPNISPNPSDDYFADGMTEELISTISRISGLHVISRTSVAQYKNTLKKIDDIGRELRVGSVIEGSVRKSSNRVRVAVQLIEVQKDEHLWSENYDRQLEDVFGIQSDIAQRVAESLRVKLLGDEKKQVERIATSDTEAHNLYFKGRYFWRQRTEAGLSKAIEYFSQAVERDPNYALGFSGLADCYTASGVYGLPHHMELSAKQRQCALRSVEIDGTLAEGHCSLATSLWWSNDSDKSEKEFERAIYLNANYSTAHQFFAQALATNGRYDEAMSQAEKARDLDPLSPTTTLTIAFVQVLAGDLEKAISELKNYRELDMNYLPINFWLGLAYVESGKLVEGIDLIKSTMPHLPIARPALAYAYAKAGMKRESLDIIEQLERTATDQFDAVDIAAIYLSLNMKEKSSLWLKKAFEDSVLAPDFLYRYYPWFKELWSDEKFRSSQKIRTS
jgi:TolB-like protein/Flp pilus assembly protein TadD